MTKQSVILSPTMIMKRRPLGRENVGPASPRRRCKSLADANWMFITLLRADQNRQAISVLKKSLRAILSSATKSPLQETLMSSQIRCQEAPEMEYSGEDCITPDGAFVFFNKILLFDSIEDERCAASVILYNMGTVYHRQAIQRGRSDLYRTAIQFYLLSQKAATARTCRNSCYHFAVVNNLGHCSAHLFQINRAALCLQTLLNNRARYASVCNPEDFVLNATLVAAPMA